MVLLVLDLSKRLVRVINFNLCRKVGLGRGHQSGSRWNRCRRRDLLSGWLNLSLKWRLRLGSRFLDERPFRNRDDRRIGQDSWDEFLIQWTLGAVHHLFIVLDDWWYRKGYRWLGGLDRSSDNLGPVRSEHTLGSPELLFVRRGQRGNIALRLLRSNAHANRIDSPATTCNIMNVPTKCSNTWNRTLRPASSECCCSPPIACRRASADRLTPSLVRRSNSGMVISTSISTGRQPRRKCVFKYTEPIPKSKPPAAEGVHRVRSAEPTSSGVVVGERCLTRGNVGPDRSRAPTKYATVPDAPNSECTVCCTSIHTRRTAGGGPAHGPRLGLHTCGRQRVEN